MGHATRCLPGDLAFAAAARAARRAAGRTQAELAAAAGVTEGTLAKIEQGQRRVTIGEAAAIAEALGRSLDDMVAERVPVLAKAPPGRPRRNR